MAAYGGRMRHITASRTRLGAVVVTPLLAVLLLGGCAAGMSGSQPDIALEPAVGGVQSDQMGSAPDGMTESGLVGSSMVAADRSVITTGWATVLVEQPTTAADDAIGIVEAAGGRIDGRSESAPTEYSSGSASLTLRIPSDRLTEVLTELKALGDVQNVSLQASDVTLQVNDLDARISAMRTSIDRLTALLAQASDIDALISLETAISDRQAQLESMLAEQRWLGDQVSMSTIQLEFVSEQVAPEPEPNTFLDGLAAGWAAFVGFLGGLLVAIGFLLPWLLMFAVIGAIVLVIVRATVGRANRRAAAPVADAAPVTTSEPTPPTAP
jgi:hypothetical protein